MRVGEALLELTRANGMRSLFVVGTGKNVGKTVTMRAVARAAARCGLRAGLTSTGRDGEAVDVTGAQPKPRLFLAPGCIIATAHNLLVSHPASEILDLTDWQTAAGTVVFARVRRRAYYELAGPSTASAMRACVRRLHELGAAQVIVDGALDRVAALAGGEDAVVIAAGAAGARTMDEAVDDIRALYARLSIARYDRNAPFLKIAGALTASHAGALYARPQKMQIVIGDPTQLVASGKTLLGILQRLDVRCERPVNVVAATVASIGSERYFEPRAFARDVAQATGLPVFDVYAGEMAAA